MPARLHYEPLKASHLDELATVLLHPLVYEYIDSHTPDLAEFKLGLERAIAGPLNGSVEHEQTWLNYLVRNEEGSMIGRLEATLHDGIAEIAFLFGPTYWGNGYAREGLTWLRTEIERLHGHSSFWATTLPENLRCQRLLYRSGYVLAGDLRPPLLSYEDGDLVFKYESRPHGSTQEQISHLHRHPVFVAPLEAEDANAARDVIVAGLTERWGAYEAGLNPDLESFPASYPDAHIVAAKSNGQLVGVGILLPTGPNSARIVRMSVRLDKRREGIGSTILSSLLSRARDLDIHDIALETTATWQSAVHFYKAHGFVPAYQAGGEQYFIFVP
jgi:GNAT superfamily N-acetyltransferase